MTNEEGKTVLGYNYTRVAGVYTSKLPWGEVITASSKDALIHLINTAERRHNQRVDIRNKAAERRRLWTLSK